MQYPHLFLVQSSVNCRHFLTDNPSRNWWGPQEAKRYPTVDLHGFWICSIKLWSGLAPSVPRKRNWMAGNYLGWWKHWLQPFSSKSGHNHKRQLEKQDVPSTECPEAWRYGHVLLCKTHTDEIPLSVITKSYNFRNPECHTWGVSSCWGNGPTPETFSGDSLKASLPENQISTILLFSVAAPGWFSICFLNHNHMASNAIHRTILYSCKLAGEKLFSYPKTFIKQELSH